MYPYQREYDRLFDTEQGRKSLEEVREAAGEFEGEFTAGDMITRITRKVGAADCWTVLNALDHLVKDSTLRSLDGDGDVTGQDRRYIAA